MQFLKISMADASYFSQLLFPRSRSPETSGFPELPGRGVLWLWRSHSCPTIPVGAASPVSRRRIHQALLGRARALWADVHPRLHSSSPHRRDWLLSLVPMRLLQIETTRPAAVLLRMEGGEMDCPPC